MITTTTTTIPNTEITEILSVVHNRVVLGTNLLSDIGAGLSDIFGGSNTSYEKKLAEITNQVIEGLKEKGKKIKADALIDLKIDVDEISGGSKSMFMVTAIATAVKLNKQISQIDTISIDTINLNIIKNRILQNIDNGSFYPAADWVEQYLINNPLPEAFEPYLNWVYLKDPSNWQMVFSAYISNLNNEDLLNKTFSNFSKENRTAYENTALSIIFDRCNVDYSKILQILSNNEDREKQRLCLNFLYHYKKSYTNADFEVVKMIIEKIKEVFPKLSKEEIGTSIMNKGKIYWICECGNKNEAADNTNCYRCRKDEYGNFGQTRKASEVILKLEELLKAKD
jgi:uncharacterized protein YbjQ (UPF0145 family)